MTEEGDAFAQIAARTFAVKRLLCESLLQLVQLNPMGRIFVVDLLRQGTLQTLVFRGLLGNEKCHQLPALIFRELRRFVFELRERH